MIGTDIAISVSGLEKSYKDLEVLKGINFTVKQGSCPTWFQRLG